jgi:hypothetical protein
LCRKRTTVPLLAAAAACTLACAWASTSSTSPGAPTVESIARFALIPEEVRTAASVPAWSASSSSSVRCSRVVPLRTRLPEELVP